MNKQLEKSRYDEEELEEFRALILKKLEKARKELTFYQQQLEDFSSNFDNKIKGLDDGTGTVENEQMVSMAGRQKKLITHLENALIRIESKTYGICRDTGKLIPKERLRAVPHATLCVEAKNKR